MGQVGYMNNRLLCTVKRTRMIFPLAAAAWTLDYYIVYYSQQDQQGAKMNQPRWQHWDYETKKHVMH